MVAARRRATRYGYIIGRECMPLAKYIELQESTWDITPRPVPVIVARRAGDVAITGVNIHVGRQTVTIKNSGCIPVHESTTQEEVTVAVQCPTNMSQRCSGCIANKEELSSEYDALTANPPIEGQPGWF